MISSNRNNNNNNNNHNNNNNNSNSHNNTNNSNDHVPDLAEAEVDQLQVAGALRASGYHIILY